MSNSSVFSKSEARSRVTGVTRRTDHRMERNLCASRANFLHVVNFIETMTLYSSHFRAHVLPVLLLSLALAELEATDNADEAGIRQARTGT